MKLPLSSRLLACAGFVSPGDRVADVGCDHGYLSIYLLTQGIARSVIASDVNEQPLLSAVHNAEKYGVRDRMEFYLSDGVRGIPRDFNTMVCAGMGADTMISILEAAPWLRSSQYRLILQCQSKTPSLRQYLSESGWRIAQVQWAPSDPRLAPGQWYFPPALLENPGSEVPAYYRRVVNGLKIAVTGRGEAAGSTLNTCLAELEALPENNNLSWLTEEHEHDNRG